MKKIYLFTMLIIICLLIALFFFNREGKIVAEDSEIKLFPLWDGNSVITPPYESDIVCIVQCEPMQIEWEGKKVKSREPFWNYLIKTYSDKDTIQQIFDFLYAPEEPGHSTLDTERYLLVVSVSRKLNSQSATRIPYQLSKDGYAITPCGKDRRLYEILNGGLMEWQSRMEFENKVHRAIMHIIAYDSLHRDRFSREGFEDFLRQKNEDPNENIRTLQTYYRDPNFLENWQKKKDRVPSATEYLMRGTIESNHQ
jgi:hypothetical protein